MFFSNSNLSDTERAALKRVKKQMTSQDFGWSGSPLTKAISGKSDEFAAEVIKKVEILLPNDYLEECLRYGISASHLKLLLDKDCYKNTTRTITGQRYSSSETFLTLETLKVFEENENFTINYSRVFNGAIRKRDETLAKHCLDKLVSSNQKLSFDNLDIIVNYTDKFLLRNLDTICSISRYNDISTVQSLLNMSLMYHHEDVFNQIAEYAHLKPSINISELDFLKIIPSSYSDAKFNALMAKFNLSDKNMLEHRKKRAIQKRDLPKILEYDLGKDNENLIAECVAKAFDKKDYQAIQQAMLQGLDLNAIEADVYKRALPEFLKDCEDTLLVDNILETLCDHNGGDQIFDVLIPQLLNGKSVDIAAKALDIYEASHEQKMTWLEKSLQYADGNAVLQLMLSHITHVDSAPHSMLEKLADRRTPNITKVLVEKGLKFGDKIDSAISSARYNEETKEYLLELKSLEMSKRYPYWERPTDQTIDQISLWMLLGKDETMTLRQRFNFHAGTIHQMYETRKGGRLSNTVPADTLSFDDVSQELLQGAKAELEKSGGLKPGKTKLTSVDPSAPGVKPQKVSR